MAETKVLAKIGTASAFIDIALVAVLVKPFEANGATLARIAMFLIAFLLTQKTLAAKAQIRINLSHFAKTIALAVVVALPHATLDCVLTYSHRINPITRLILDGISFLIVYIVFFSIFRVVGS